MFWVDGYMDVCLLLGIGCFCNNWELFVVCVIFVVWYFIENGVDFRWLVVVGFGEF